MSFETGLREELMEISGLSNKVFPLIAPEGTDSPYLVYRSSEGVNDKTLTGFLASKSVSGEVDVVCSSYGEMKQITSGVIQHLQSFVGRTIGTSGILVKDIMVGEPLEMYETQVNMFRCNIEFTVYI